MPKLKSLITRTEIDTAKKAHGCRSNRRHRIETGDPRLKVRIGRSWQHYCLECARAILHSDIKKLEIIMDRIETDLEN